MKNFLQRLGTPRSGGTASSTTGSRPHTSSTASRASNSTPRRKGEARRLFRASPSSRSVSSAPSNSDPISGLERSSSSSRRRRPRTRTFSKEEDQETCTTNHHSDQESSSVVVRLDFSSSAEDEIDRLNRLSVQAEELDQRGSRYFEAGDYGQAFLCYERAFDLKRQCTTHRHHKQDEQDKSQLASVATSINNITYLKHRAGEASLEETMEAYLNALKMKRDVLGPDHISVGKTLNNVGSVFYLKQEYEPALKAYQDARMIMSKNLGEESLDVGTVTSNIGDVLAQEGKREEALVEYRKALNIRWKALGRQDPKVIRLMELIAQLETGVQPMKSLEDDSESENEEFILEDQGRDQLLKKDIQILQEELESDIQLFTLMEKQMALDMVKEKTRIFREMREQFNSFKEDESNTEHSERDDIMTEHGSPVRETKKVVGQPASPETALERAKMNVAARLKEPLVALYASKENNGDDSAPNTSDRVRSQRNNALTGVKERLAKLRERRNFRDSSQRELDAVERRPSSNLTDVSEKARRILEAHQRDLYSSDDAMAASTASPVSAN